MEKLLSKKILLIIIVIALVASSYAARHTFFSKLTVIQPKVCLIYRVSAQKCYRKGT